MRKIFKYNLDEGIHNVPGMSALGDEVLDHGIVRHVGFDPRGQRCIWIEVNPDLPTERRAFVHIDTGAKIPEYRAYRGTYIDGTLVLHVYEVDPKLLS